MDTKQCDRINSQNFNQTNCCNTFTTIFYLSNATRSRTAHWERAKIDFRNETMNLNETDRASANFNFLINKSCFSARLADVMKLKNQLLFSAILQKSEWAWTYGEICSFAFDVHMTLLASHKRKKRNKAKAILRVFNIPSGTRVQVHEYRCKRELVSICIQLALVEMATISYFVYNIIISILKQTTYNGSTTYARDDDFILIYSSPATNSASSYRIMVKTCSIRLKFPRISFYFWSSSFFVC